jgi:hypothetical protein
VRVKINFERRREDDVHKTDVQERLDDITAKTQYYETKERRLI